MTISAHLTPKPEERLRFLLDTVSHSAEWADRKIGALTFFAAAEAAFIHTAIPHGPLSALALVMLGAALPLGVLAFSPLTRVPRWLAILEPPVEKSEEGNGFIDVESLANHSRQDLVLTLDKYLGGGITSTPYFEDLVGQIILHARVTARKRRLFGASCALVGVGQMALLAQLIYISVRL